MSLVPLIVVQQLSEAMIRGIAERFIELGTYHLQAVARLPVESDAADAAKERLSILPGVRSAAVEMQGFALLHAGERRTGVTVRAVEEEFWRDDPAVARLITVTSGSLDLSAENAIVLGVAVAQALDAGVGDEVRLLTVRSLGDGRYLPRISRFTVTGVVSTGYRDLDRLWVFVPLERGRRILSRESSREVMGIKIDDPYALPNPLFNRGLRAIAGATAREGALTTVEEVATSLTAEWFVSDWYGSQRSRYVSFQTTRNLLVFIMAMVLVVAAINISSSLIMLVLEKESEIAILRATGVPRGVITGAFLWVGATVGGAGAAVASVVGLAISLRINAILAFVDRAISFLGGETSVFNADYYLETIPVAVEIVPLLGAVALALIVSLLAGTLPALRAARIRPDRVLRRHG